MDKATKVAGEKYPHGKFDGELGDSLRAACAVGYIQAEKDLALTWEDMKKINDLFIEVTTIFATVGMKKILEQLLEQPYYEEVAKRFNEQKKK